MTELTQITSYSGIVPNKATQTKEEFANAVYPYLNYFNSTFTPQSQDLVADLNTLSTEINEAKDVCEVAKDLVNYKGIWSTSSDYYPYAVGVTVTDGDDKYLSLVDNNDAQTSDTSSWECVIPKKVPTVSTDFKLPDFSTLTDNIFILTDELTRDVRKVYDKNTGVWNYLDLSKAIKVEMNNFGAVALMPDGYLWALGDNYKFGLGLPEDKTYAEWTKITVMSNVIDFSVSTSGYTIIAIDTNNDLYGIGYNSKGELGTGDTNAVTEWTNLNQKAKYIFGKAGWHTAIIGLDDIVYTCGQNNYGQLGLGDTDDRLTFTSTGVDAVFGTCLDLGDTFLVKSDGSLWFTGRNYNGESGLGDTNSRSSFTSVPIGTDTVSKLAGRSYGTVFFINQDGELYGAGYNYKGQLGLGDTNDRHTFTDIGIKAKEVAITSFAYTTTFIIGTDDILYSTGYNGKYLLDTGDTTDRNTFANMNKSVDRLICGFQSFMYIRGVNRYCIGVNNYYQLGLPNDKTDKTTFEQYL